MFYTAGFLGSEFGPIFIPVPLAGLDSVKFSVGMLSYQRFEKRNQLYKDLSNTYLVEEKKQ